MDAKGYSPANVLRDLKTMQRTGDLPKGRRHLYATYKKHGIVEGLKGDKIVLTAQGQRMAKIRKSKYIDGLY